MAQVAKHIIFSGRVQGVGFRFTAHNIARRCQLTGFVRNLPDGTVEMLAQGHVEDVNDCIRDLNETFGVGLTNTTINDIPYVCQLDDFRITF